MGNQHSYTLDAETQLKDDGLVAATAAAEVGGSAKIHDFGNITSGPAVEQVAFTEARLVIDVSALEFGDGDEVFTLIFQLSDDASGAGTGFDGSDTVVNRAVFPMGDVGGVAGSTADDDSAVGQIETQVSNEYKGTKFRFCRMFTVVGGTIATGINYEAMLTAFA